MGEIRIPVPVLLLAQELGFSAVFRTYQAAAPV